jgi:hypothetical protein
MDDVPVHWLEAPVVEDKFQKRIITNGNEQ